MPFDFDTPFPSTDPECVPRFTRSFEHIAWIDGESIVQAEQTPTEEGFNTRFNRIIEDLDALGDESRRALECTAAIRTSLFAIITELETELNRLGAPIDVWHALAPQNGWTVRAPDTEFDYNPPGYFRDRSNVIHLRGTVGNGPIPSVANGFASLIATLPVGYRPENRTVLSALFPGPGVARLDVAETGALILRSPYTSWISLDGLSFRQSTVLGPIDPDIDIGPIGPGINPGINPGIVFPGPGGGGGPVIGPRPIP